MTLDPNALEKLTRDELISRARELGAKRPELLTRPELRDEIIRLSVTESEEQRRARGWFGVARDLVASVVGQGLNLPDAADLIRGVHVFSPIPAPPVATVTLAEIYAAQGHLKKALDLLDEVLQKEPDHLAARQARERWAKTVPSEVSSRHTDEADLEPAQAADFTNDAEPTAPDLTTADIAADSATAQQQLEEASTRPPHGHGFAIGAEQEPAPDTMLASSDGVEWASSRSERQDASLRRHDDDVASASTAGVSSARDVALDAHSYAGVAPEPDASAASAVDSAPEAPAGELNQQALAASRGNAETAAASTPGVNQPLQDQLFLFRMSDGTCWCYWSLTRASMKLAEPVPGESVPQFTIHVVEIRPSWDGPTVTQWHLEIDGATGCRQLSQQASGTELRLVLGLSARGTLKVLAVAAEFLLSNVGAPQLRFAPPASLAEQAWLEAGDAALPEVLRARAQSGETATAS